MSTFRGQNLTAKDSHSDDGLKDGACAAGNFAQVGTNNSKNINWNSLVMSGT